MVAFSAGVLITMITVAVSAFRVSKLNISVAIRGLPEQFTAEDTFSLTHRFALLGKATAGPFYFAYKFVRTARGRGSSRVVLVFGMLLGVPVLGWSIWFLRIVVAAFGLISPYVKLGWPLIALGLLFSVLGMQLDSASLFSVGVSILFVGIGLFLKVLLSIWRLRDEFVARISSTVIGIPVLVFWALPSDALNGLTGELNDSEISIALGPKNIGVIHGAPTSVNNLIKELKNNHTTVLGPEKGETLLNSFVLRRMSIIFLFDLVPDCTAMPAGLLITMISLSSKTIFKL